ncbi:MAG: hypothetical protein RJA57_1043 [Bacteroidota bacterium]|jgi:hypothetical protein
MNALRYSIAVWVASSIIACKSPEQATTQTQTRIQQQTANSYQIDVTKDGVFQKPLVADLELGSEKVSLERTYANMTADQAKENITAEMALQYDCDIVVQPVYLSNSTMTDSENKIKITLIGTPGYFRNIRTYEPADQEAFLIRNYIRKGNTAEKSVTTETVIADSTVAPPAKPEKKKKMKAILKAAGL